MFGWPEVPLDALGGGSGTAQTSQRLMGSATFRISQNSYASVQMMTIKCIVLAGVIQSVVFIRIAECGDVELTADRFAPRG